MMMSQPPGQEQSQSGGRDKGGSQREDSLQATRISPQPAEGFGSYGSGKAAGEEMPPQRSMVMPQESQPASGSRSVSRDTRKMVAEVAVSERLFEYLSPGSGVTAKVATRPLKSYAGSVAMISPATLEQPATASAGRDPGVPSALPDRFVALAVFDNSDGSLLPGAEAKVKIHTRHESYLSRGFSVVWRWLRAILW